MNFETELYQLLSNVKTIIKTQPLCLGGYSGENGGSGGPPAGFIGQLPQDRVTYDTTEAEISGTSTAASLVDNLNHIRYRIKLLEEVSNLSVEEEDVLVATPVKTLNFENMDVVDEGSGKVSVIGAPSGVDIEDNDVAVASNVKTLNFEGFTVTDEGSSKVTIASSGSSGSDGVPIGSIFPYAGTTAPTSYRICNGDELSETTYATLASLLGYVYGYQVILVNDVDDWVRLDTVDVYTTGQGVKFSSTDTLPVPLNSSTQYYVRRDGASLEYTIHPTESDAINNTNKIDLTSVGSGLITMQKWGYVRIPDTRGKFVLASRTGGSETEYIRGQKGGEETHTLTVSEMPEHAHNFDDVSVFLNTDSTTYENGDWTSVLSEAFLEYVPVSASTYGTGDGFPHNNMPPFLVMNYIIKVL